jgi:hypothetical protein
LAVGSEDAQVADLVGVVAQPGSARLLEAGVQDVTVSALDHA